MPFATEVLSEKTGNLKRDLKEEISVDWQTQYGEVV